MYSSLSNSTTNNNVNLIYEAWKVHFHKQLEYFGHDTDKNQNSNRAEGKDEDY